jgi:fatty acid desaturase
MKLYRLFPKLRHLADLRTLVFVVVALVLLGGSWSRLLRNPLAMAASCLMAFVCCIIAHNHMHQPVFHGRFWNRVF